MTCPECSPTPIPGMEYRYMGKPVPFEEWTWRRELVAAQSRKRAVKYAGLEATLGLNMNRCAGCGAPRREP